MLSQSGLLACMLACSSKRSVRHYISNKHVRTLLHSKCVDFHADELQKNGKRAVSDYESLTCNGHTRTHTRTDDTPGRINGEYLLVIFGIARSALPT